MANNRHIKYLNFDDHGFSVLDLTAEAGADGLVRHQRPRRPRRDDHLDDVVRHPGRHQPGASRSTGRWAADVRRRQRGRAALARLAASRRTCVTRRSPARRAAVLDRAARRGVRGRAPDAEARATCWCVDGCRPDEITPALTPNLHRAARRRAALPAGLVDAGDGDHPQPRDDDDRRAAGPDRRARRTRSSTAALGEVRDHGPRRATSGARTVIGRLNRAGLHDRDGAQQGVPLRRLRRPGHPPLGAGADRPGLRPRARPVHDGRRARDGRGVRPAPGVRQPRRHRPVRARRPHRPIDVQAARQARAGRHRPPGAALRRPAEVDRPLGALDRDRARRPLDGLVAPDRRDQPARAAHGRRPAARRQGRDRRQRRRRPPLLDRARRRPRRGGRTGCGRSRRPRPGVLAAHDRRDRRRCAWARRPATSWSFCQAGLAVQRARPDRQPDPGQPRPPGHPRRSRSSSAAATRPCRDGAASSALAAHRRRGADGGARSSASAHPAAGTTAATGSDGLSRRRSG